MGSLGELLKGIDVEAAVRASYRHAGQPGERNSANQGPRDDG